MEQRPERGEAGPPDSQEQSMPGKGKARRPHKGLVCPGPAGMLEQSTSGPVQAGAERRGLRDCGYEVGFHSEGRRKPLQGPEWRSDTA